MSNETEITSGGVESGTARLFLKFKKQMAKKVIIGADAYTKGGGTADPRCSE